MQVLVTALRHQDLIQAATRRGWPKTLLVAPSGKSSILALVALGTCDLAP